MRRIDTDSAPKAIGPYSQAVEVDGLLFCSGQIALDPSSMTMVEGGVRAQTEQVMKNLAAVLRASGAALNTVVKTTIYLVDMNDFGEVNEVYASFFEEETPARATVEVSRLPKGALVEIDAVAVTAKRAR